MTASLEVRTAHNLMCVGLYTICFEAMVLLWRQQLSEYLSNHETKSLPALKKACKTADETFAFCAPYLLVAGIVEQADLDKLIEIRRRRNVFAHEGYNSIWSLHFSDISDDLDFIDKLAFNVQNWRFSTQITKPPMNVGESIRMTVSPRMFTNLIRKIADQVSNGLLHYDLDKHEVEQRSTNNKAMQE